MLTRRTFLAAVSSTIGAGSLVGMPASGLPRSAGRVTTIQDVVDLIIAAVPGAPREGSVDTFKAGDPSQPVSGIVTTFLATCDVIEQAAALGANFIITHEPTYYNHLDETDWLADDPVYAHKRRMLDEHGIAVWRFHDYWHLHEPDGILTGMLKTLGWDEMVASEADRRDLPSIVQIEPMTVSELADFFKAKLGITHPLQLVGDPSLVCRRVGLLLGAYGGRPQIEFLRESEFDVLVVGEISEWETSVYVTDARCAGQERALLMLGHANSEEPGMEWMAEWLRARLEDVPVTHVPATDPFNLI